jgi:hypothetical protein
MLSILKYETCEMKKKENIFLFKNLIGDCITIYILGDFQLGI